MHMLTMNRCSLSWGGHFSILVGTYKRGGRDIICSDMTLKLKSSWILFLIYIPDLASSRQEAFLFGWSEKYGGPELTLFSAPGWDILPSQALFSSSLLIQVKVTRALSFWLFPWPVWRRQLHMNAGCVVMINLQVCLCGYTCLQALVRT